VTFLLPYLGICALVAFAFRRREPRGCEGHWVAMPNVVLLEHRFYEKIWVSWSRDVFITSSGDMRDL
jgi:hypothetical protein